MSGENLLGGTLQAQVRVESLPAARQIVAVERQLDGSWRVCGYGQSGVDGLAELPVQGRPDSTIYALAVDDWGTPWAGSREVAIGDIIRPSNFVGWLYRVTEAGTLAADEPVWWNSAGLGPQPVGSATLQAERYYQPVAHGPMSVEFDEGFDPYWSQVVSLIHFDGTQGAAAFHDEKSQASWTGGGQLRNNPEAIGGSELKLTGLDRFGLRPPGGIGFGYDVLSEPFSLEFIYQRGTKTFTWVYGIGGGAASWGGSSSQIDLLIATGQSHELQLQLRSGTSTPRVIATEPLDVSGRYRVGVFRDESAYYFFVDGQLIGTTPLGGVPFSGSASRSVSIGSIPGAGVSSSAYFPDASIDEYRFTRGIARHTENYDANEPRFPDF